MDEAPQKHGREGLSGLPFPGPIDCPRLFQSFGVGRHNIDGRPMPAPPIQLSSNNPFAAIVGAA
jgi:hypothetical protein